MKKGGKPVNYRSGDRSETLGIPLLQMLCAVAPVPRQEDWGIFDAVATLLRREDEMLYAGESFMVQFKGRSVRQIPYQGRKLKALLLLEFPLFAARVDLRECSIELFTLGRVMGQPGIDHHDKVRVHLGVRKRPPKAKGAWWVAETGEPILRWTSADLENEDFRKQACEVLQKWLELELWNRRLRRLGKQIQIGWKTNEVPSEQGHTIHFSAANEEEMLGELVAPIQVIRMIGRDDEEITRALASITDWMRAKGVDPDPKNIQTLMSVMGLAQKRVAEVLQKHPDGELGVTMVPEYVGPDGCIFWLFGAGGGGRKITGTLDELRNEGYEFDLDENGCPVSVDLGKKWLQKRNFAKVSEEDNVVVLRRIDSK